MHRRTLATEVSASGIALHAGVPANVTLVPAASGSGVVFRRRDRVGSAPIPALWSNVVDTRLGTVLSEENGPSVAVVEHLMSALTGAELDDCVIEVDGPEPPILDGDALSYLNLIEKAGVREQPGKRPKLHLNCSIKVESGAASCTLIPAPRSEYYFEIEFDSSAIGKQHYEVVLSPVAFREEIAPARTFGFLHEADALRAAGLARGADLSNTLVVDGDKVINADLQRFEDEFVRHKILDAIGDLGLAGLPIVARFEGRRSSHSLNNALLRALFSDPANYEIRD